MKVKECPAHDRPRERLVKYGAAALSDVELLAVLVGSGTKNNSALEIAQVLLSEFGNLRSITEAERKKVCLIKGFGITHFLLLQATIEIVRRSLLESMKKGSLVNSPKKTRDYLALKMRHYKHEVFACLFLDNQHYTIAFEEMFYGTIDGASVHPREVVKRVLYHNAAAVIFVHNHPSGSDEPSISDERITQKLKEALNMIDVRVLDHFVIGENVTSFAERELI